MKKILENIQLLLKVALLVVFTIGVGSCFKSCYDSMNSMADYYDTKGTKQSYVPSGPHPSNIAKVSWGYMIEFTGYEFNGIKPLANPWNAEREIRGTIRWVPGNKIHNPDGQSYDHPYGSHMGYDPRWKNRFRFSWCPGISPHAVLILKKKTADTLDSVRQKDILYFKRPEREIRFQLNPGEELIFYYHDVNEPWFFQRNGTDGSYLRFEIEIF